MIYEDATKIIGKTPMVSLARFTSKSNVSGELLVKIEGKNPGGSIKDRVALYMIEAAEKSGCLRKDGCIIEPTSGNTGIGLALVCAACGYRLILTMPSSMSEERKKTLRALGAELVLTAPERGMAGAVEEAERLKKEIDGAIILDQFSNPDNPRAHYESTAVEILEDCEGKIDALVAGVGTGGTISGIGKRLKEEIEGVKIIAVEPFDSPLLSKGVSGAHKIQGIGANFVPKTFDKSVVDTVIAVKTEEAYSMARQLALTEGITCGISGGAALFAALSYLKENEGKRVVVILPDGGDRYLSTDLFE